MAKGILLEAHGREGTVLTPAGEFKRVPLRSPARIGDEVSFAESPRRRSMWWLSAAAIIIFALAGSLFISPAAPVVAMVTVDINPSVELAVDAEDIVVRARALNDDGEAVLEALDGLKGMTATDAVAALVNMAAELGKLDVQNTEDFVLVTVRPAGAQAQGKGAGKGNKGGAGGGDGEQEPSDEQTEALQELGQELQDAALGIIRNRHAGVAQVQATLVTAEQAAEAEALGVPVGKLVLAQFAESQVQDLDIPEAEIKNLPVGQVYRLLSGKLTVDEFLAKLNHEQMARVKGANGKGPGGEDPQADEESPDTQANENGPGKGKPENPGSQGKGKPDNAGQSGQSQGKGKPDSAGQGRGRDTSDSDSTEQDTADNDSNTDSNQGQDKGVGRGKGRGTDGEGDGDVSQPGQGRGRGQGQSGTGDTTPDTTASNP